jgi:hypothetical protein
MDIVPTMTNITIEIALESPRSWKFDPNAVL